MSTSGTAVRRSERKRQKTSDEPAIAHQLETRSQSQALSTSTEKPSPERFSKNGGITPEEEVDDDGLCPVCRLLLYRPVTTRCNHTLCESCMAHWADVSVMTQMQIVDVDSEPVAFDAVSGLEAKCPMCRTQTTASLNPTLADSLKAKYPQTWAERHLEEADSSLGSDQASIQTLTVYIGNRHRMIGEPTEERSNQHEWTFFVRPSRTDIIEEVQILLHPTFRPNRVIRQRAPYEIRRLGWGVFTITAYVILKAGYTWVSEEAEVTPDGVPKGMLPLTWELDFLGFEGKGSMGSVRLKVKNDREWQDISSEEERDDREWQRVMRQYQRDGRYEPPTEED
ncbi:YEATS domain-containing protein 2 [Pseudocercospora fuligena]|uniref:YEATS domain-containing protein 2 n=1 Tax=Pseudocercospora fuligena TaxID=685502 RepID=A0A8H6R8K4_9PEZI|nr:YEATS domain-containing protein 2 [Pseudocercospora fuligena]